MSRENPWKRLSSRVVYQNAWITVREDQVIRPDGKPGIYGVVETRIAAGVAAITENRELYLVGQFRYPTNEYSWEIIEGGTDGGESALSGAQRELKEEAGITAAHWEQLGGEIHLTNCHSSEIGVLFATPPVLTALGGRLAPERRASIRGIHLGGMAAAPGFWKELGERFPNATVLGGYGNSLAGVCPQVAPDPDAPPEYFPCGARLVLEVVAPAGSRRGRVRFHRLDLSCFLPNVLERDVAESVAPPPHARAAAFDLAGLRDPRPPEDAAEAQSPGLY